MEALGLGEILDPQSPRITSVHPKETPVIANTATPCGGEHDDVDCWSANPIHAGWAPLRKRTHAAMRNAGISPNSRETFRSCADSAWVLQDVERPTSFKIVRDFCHNRWCRICSAKRGWLIKTNLARLIENRECRLLTLTVKSDGLSLTQCLDKLYKGFRRLRTSAIWKERVDGGIYVTEVKWSDRSGVWHPHLHCIIEGRFLPHDLLKKNWLRATGDSSIVDIRPIHDKAGTAGYLTKYLSKTCDATVTDDEDRFAEAIKSLKGRRLCGCYGTWSAERLTHSEPERATRKIGHINELRLRAADGDELSKKLLLAWAAMPGEKACVEVEIPLTVPPAQSKELGP
jgi:Replication protein